MPDPNNQGGSLPPIGSGVFVNQEPMDVPPPPNTGPLPVQAVREQNYQPQIPPTQSLNTSGGKKPGDSGAFPVKYVLIGIGAIFLLSAIFFSVWKFVINKPKPQEQITLTYWGIWEEDATVQTLISEFQSQNKNVKINYVKQSKQDYRERLASNLAKGAGPDVFEYHNTWVPMFTSQLASLPPTIMDLNQYQSIFYPSAVQDLRRGPDIVGVPLGVDGLGLYINQDIFDKANKNIPTTWDELRRLAKELTIKDENGQIVQAGVALGRIENVDHWEDIIALLLLQGEADLSNPVGNLTEAPIKYYSVFNKEDHVWDETLPTSTRAFTSGKLAMYFGPSWRVADIKRLNPNLNFKVIPVPQLPKNGPAQPDINYSSYWAAGVWSKSKGINTAWKFLTFMTGKEQLQRLYAGMTITSVIGLPYPRQDMSMLIESDPYVGAYAKEASSAHSWYLASQTYDGSTGINSKISSYFADVLSGVIKDNKEPSELLPTAAVGIKQILSGYGVR